MTDDVLIDFDVSDLDIAGERISIEDINRLANCEIVNSILLYGSAAREEASHRSDLDVLVLIGNNKLDSISKIESEFEFQKEENKRQTRVVNYFDGKLADLSPVRATTISAYEQMDFAEVSRKNPIMKYILPWRIRHERIHQESVPIYGEKPKFPDLQVSSNYKKELIKSLLTRMAFATLMYFCIFFSEQYKKYLFDSYKWSLLNCGYIIDNSNMKINDCVGEVRHFFLTKDTYSSYRGGSTPNLLKLKIPVEILLIHLWTLYTVSLKDIMD